MAGYSVTLQRTGSTSASLGSLSAPGSSMRRVKIYDAIFGSEATPADNAFLWQYQRTTAAGTSTAVTPQPLDPADAACAAVAGQNHTVEPTYTANAILLTVPLNQRPTFRWVAKDGKELVIPATANAGIGIKTPTASAVAITNNLMFEEQ